VIDVRGNDGATGRDLGAYELRSHVIGNAGAPGVTVPGRRCTHLPSEIFADGDVLHLRGDDAGACVGELCHAETATRAQWYAAFGKLRRAFATGGDTVVDRLDPPPGVGLDVAAAGDPGRADAWQPVLDIDGDRGVGVGTGGIVDRERRFPARWV